MHTKVISDMYHKEIINTYIHTHACTKVSHIQKAPQRVKCAFKNIIVCVAFLS